MRRLAIVCFASVLAAHHPAWAKAGDDDEEEEEDEDDEDDEEDDEDEETKPAPKPEAKKPAAKQGEFKKQDLRGHAVDADKIANPFQKDRFFVDKVDTAKTAKGTLIQGSLQWSNFAYRESGGDLPDSAEGLPAGSAASKFSRYFTDLRLQTDFRHISGGRWDARVDMRGRYVATPGEYTSPTGMSQSADENRVQSGFQGENELEIREAWIVHAGKRTDLFFGRQFVPDLGAIKIDGLRFDYASSEKITFLGFGGLYPVRGSRSLTTDYPELRTNDGEPTSNLTEAGRLVTAGGFGAAYRTINMHGALGGVAIVPLSSERPRIYATSNGYYRAGTKLDFYHYAILDLFGANADPIALTNLSAGVNYKPGQRLRMTASFNRVDTESLNVQAGAFLDNPVLDVPEGGTKVQNEAFIQLKRISTNSARGSLSVALGELNRFEITVASAYRYRPEVTLTPANAMAPITLEAAKGVDVYGSIIDRRSLFELRLGVDASRSFAVGDTAFARSEILSFRTFASREIGKGRGEWEAEISYATTKDKSGGMAAACTALSPADCFGASQTKVISVGGQVYYRIKGNVFGIGNLYVSQLGLDRVDATGGKTADPSILSLTGFVRVAYRF